MDNILTTAGLSRAFGRGTDLNWAVRDVSLHVKKGDIYGLIGRNGAGKTTILKMVGGLIRPTNGQVTLMGKSFEEAASSGSLAKVGSLIEAPGLQNGMTGHDNLRLKCICAGIPYDAAYIHGLLETVGLADAEFKKAGNYSLGMKQRLGIALALVGEPELLVLDEPINGLDPQGIAEVREMLQRLNRERGMTILISSHILEEMSKLVTTVGIIDKGHLLREFSREDMERECSSRVTLRTPAPEDALRVLSGLGFTEAVIVDERTVDIYERTGETPLMVRALTEAGVPVSEIFLCGQTLEEFFFSIVGGARHA